MNDTDRGTTANVGLKRPLIILAALLAVAVLAATSGDVRPPVASSETRFVEYSESGLQIVPASCPSYAHFTGDCSATPPSPSQMNQCSISSVLDTIEQGQSTTLGWSTYPQSGVQPPTDPYAPGGTGGWGVISASISPTVGSVPGNGSTVVSPNTTTTYTLSGVYRSCFKGCLDYNFSCSRAITVNAPSCTPSFSCSGDNLINSCTGAVSQVCEYGCVSGGCIPASLGEGDLIVAPALVRQGETTTVTWNTEGMESCTVVEDNPGISDSWTGVTGVEESSPISEQTWYTLTCIPEGGGSSVESDAVSIRPSFEEQ